MNVVKADGNTVCENDPRSNTDLNNKTIELDGEVFELTSPRSPCDVSTCKFCYKVGCMYASMGFSYSFFVC